MANEIKTMIKTDPIMVRTDIKDTKIPAPKIWVYRCEEKNLGEYLNDISLDIKNKYGRNSKYFLDNPIVYIHAWKTIEYPKNNNANTENSFIVDKIYIGEAENLITRQKQHWDNAKKAIEKGKEGKKEWRLGLVNDFSPEDHTKRVVPVLYVIACNLFTKSMTLEIEDKLINYAMSMNSSGKHPQTRIQNGRYNPQREYFGYEFANDIFRTIWKELVRLDPQFFPSEEKIQRSVMYKMSPHHRLTDEQKEIKEFIKDRCSSIMGFYDSEENEPQLIMVEGGTGTGKSVLTAITLFELIHDTKDSHYDIKLIINQDEQQKVFNSIVKNRGLGNAVVYKASTFIHDYNTFDNDYPGNKEPADIVFIDEAHLLYTSRPQGYEKEYDKDQIKEIMKRSKITVILFDEFQALKKSQYLGEEYIEDLRTKSKKQNNYMKALVKQLRMNCTEEQLHWIDSFTGVNENFERVKGRIEPIPKNKENKYEIRIFDSPQKLYSAIETKANKKDTFKYEKKKQENNNSKVNSGLSRLLATYDWHYSDDLPETDGEMWCVTIDGFSMPWNYQYEKYIKAMGTKKNPRSLEAIHSEKIKEVIKNIDHLTSEHMDNVWNMPWQEQEQTINEIGSTYTIQGFDLEYAGVILGPSVRYNKEKEEIFFDIEEKSKNHNKHWNDMTGSRDDIDNIGTVLLENELRVLLTRGTQGLYIYAVDPDLREALLKAQSKKTRSKK